MINICMVGRVFRIILGTALMSLAFFGVLGSWAWLGLVPFLAGAVGWCPVNKLIGMKSCNVNFRPSVS